MSKKKVSTTQADVKLIIPESLMDIQLDDYQKWLVTVAEHDIEKDGLVLQQHIIAIFCKIPLDVVYRMKKSDVDDISTSLFKLLKSDSSDVVTTFTLDGIKFGIVPDFEDMSFGEFTDASEYIKDPADLHKLIAVLYRPVVKQKYNPLLRINQHQLEDYNGTSQYAMTFKKMPALIARRASFFLVNSMISLQKGMLESLQEEAETNPEVKAFLTKNMVGSTQFTDLLTSIYSESML